MFRAAPFLLISRNILHRCSLPTEIRAASLCQPPVRQKSYTQVQERAPCPCPPPPPPPPKDRRLLWGTLALALLTGFCAVSAKQSPEIRDWLTIHAPWFDDFVALVYEENMSYEEQIKALIEWIQQKMDEKERPKQCSTDGKPVPVQPVDDPPKDPPPIRCLPEEKIEEKAGKTEKDMPCKGSKPPVITKDICQLEECLRDLGDEAYHNYMTARDACRYYNKLVDETLVDISVPSLKALRPAMVERMELVEEHVCKADRASTSLDDLKRYLDCGMSAPKEFIENTKTMLKEYQIKVSNMKTEFLWDNDMAQVMDARWQQVEPLLDKYILENEAMFPSVKYDASKPHIQDDADLLLHHTLRYLMKFRAVLEEATTAVTERTNRAMATLCPNEKAQKERDALYASTFSKKKGELEQLYKKRLDDLKRENDRILKESLQKLKEKHEEYLKAKLKQKEDEAQDRIAKMVDEAVAAEKKSFEKDLNIMAFKLRVVEDKLEERLKAEREARRSQELYSAGASLLAATKRGTPKVRVDKELRALEKAAGDNDKLVQTVLKSIPDTVREDGVVPESVLRDRYHSMEKVAMRVALVEQEGAGLPIYIMSWIQSVLLFVQLSGIPQEDIDKPLRDNMDDLDTFDLLQRARYWVERGNIPAALRYVGSLDGASRAAAEAWHQDARAHLEIRQAAEAVLAHATALGLQYV